MQLALVSLLLVIVALLIVRAANRDRRDYGKFKKLKSTRKRQRTFAKWLRESFFLFGGLSAVVLLAAWAYVPLVAQDALLSPPLAWLAGLVSGDFGIGFAIGASVALLALLILPVVLLRTQMEEIPAVGDIGALLPRTRGELKDGFGLSVNAGVLEELLFRLGMPALIFGITGNGVVSFIVAAVLFGLLHLYQGPLGVLGATLLGLFFTLVYLLTGSIIVVMAIHALIDLRSLVLIPIVVQKVHRVSGKKVVPAPGE